MKWAASLLPMVLTALANAQVAIYEGRSFPEHEAWERVGSGRADRDVVDDWLVQAISIDGALDAYQKPLAGFADVKAFFIEWRAETDAPSTILETSGVPAVLSAGGPGAFYHATMTDGRVRLFRDTTIPLVFVDIEVAVPHTYRLELYGTETYAWFVDGNLVDSGLPQASYPDDESVIIWGSRCYVQELRIQTTRWDYIRYGVIPQDASGDYDSDADIDGRDFYFFHECLTNDRLGINGGPDNDAGPGCRFADFDGDGDVDLQDVAVFQQIFTGGE